MRIAFIVGRFPALSETFILGQITGLIERGHEVDIYAEPPADARVHEDVERYQLAKRTRYSPRIPSHPVARALKAALLIAAHAWKDPRKVLAALHVGRYGRAAASLRLLYAVVPFAGRPAARYDVLHCHFGSYGVRGLFLRDVGALDARLVTTFHAADLMEGANGLDAGAYARLFAAGDLFLPISEAGRRVLIARGCPAERVRVHHMGTATRRFVFRPRSRPGSGPVRFLSVCRLVEKKGIEYGIQAIARLAESGRPVRYDIVGAGPLRDALARLVERLRLSGTVTLHGARTQSEVQEMLADAHVFLAPSVRAADGDHEGIPVALMEAMASGLPVISTRHSGIPELIEDGKNGLLADERDVESLYEQAAYLLDHPGRWPELTAAARAQVEQQFDVDRLNARLVDLYEGVVRDGARCRERALEAKAVAPTSIGG